MFEWYDAVIPPGAMAGMFQKNRVNAMAADALAPSVTGSSAGMVLISDDK